eukprot:scaffold28872_cov55-Phaeocystis_antarctica.AAC.1
MSTYPEDRSRALKVYQEHQQVGRVAHQVPTFEIGGTIISRLRWPIRLEPSRSHSAHRALCDREGGECWHVRPRMICSSDEARVGGQSLKPALPPSTHSHNATADRAVSSLLCLV